ncbi:MAG: NAD(P)/FAD-dependent oxidoreductase [Comamonadaceae bacterium]|nr:MAG: NAD(P)/FAD-dependent oxidoreductase [Comamonadaceae bacterium]
MRADFVVVGASYAGLAAALQLARARRDVLVVDAGLRRNRFVDAAGGAAHGLIGQDGMAPGDIAAQARHQLARYQTVRWLDASVDTAHRLPDGGGFELRAQAACVTASRIVLATGVNDELPPVPGLQARWGRSVFHCPYCHAHELGRGPIGVIAANEQAQHLALLLPDWGETVLFLNGGYVPDAQQRADLARRGTRIEATPVVQVEGVADVHLADGRTLAMAGLFTQPRTHLNGSLAEQLGCAMAEGSAGPFIQVDEAQATSVPNVYACGDAARPSGNLALAAASGSVAGMAAHQSTVF